MRAVVMKAVEKAGMGPDPEFSAQSLRSGFVTAAQGLWPGA